MDRNMKSWSTPKMKTSALNDRTQELLANTNRYRKERDDSRRQVREVTHDNQQMAQLLSQMKEVMERQRRDHIQELENQRNAYKIIESQNKYLKTSSQRFMVEKKKTEELFKSQYDRQLAEQNQKVIDEYKTITDRTEAYSKNLEQEVQRLTQLSKRLDIENKSLAKNKERHGNVVLDKQSERSLKYYKQQNELNKRAKLSFRYKYLKLRKIYGKSVKHLHKSGSNAVEELVNQVISAANEIGLKIQDKHLSQNKTLIDDNCNKFKDMEEGVKIMESKRTDDRVNCPVKGCVHHFSDAGEVQRHLTVKHLLNENTIETIVLD